MQITPHDHVGNANTSTPAEETTLAETDARFFSMQTNLPSRMAFYPFDKLSIRPYAVQEMAKLGAAKKTGNLRMFVETIGAVIDRPISAITVPDLSYLVFWLRLASFPKRPFTLSWMCAEAEHTAQVIEGFAPHDSLKNTSLVTVSDCKANYVDLDALQPISDTLASYGLTLQMPTVADFLSSIEESRDKWTDEALYLSQFASYIAPTQEAKTLQARALRLMQLDSPTLIDDLYTCQGVMDNAKVFEATRAQCAHCGSVQEVTLDVSANFLDFFPY